MFLIKYSQFEVIEENLDNFNVHLGLNGLSTITPTSILSEANGKNTDKVLARWLQGSLAYRDFIRQGLVNMPGTNFTFSDDQNDSSIDAESPFKVSLINCNYQICKSYPALLIVARETSDEAIKKNSKCHRLNRFPVVVWRHPSHRSLLLRSSGFHSKGFIGMLMKGQTNAGQFKFQLF